MSGPFKMKGFSAHAGVSPIKRETAQSRKDKNDPILQGAIKTAKKNATKTSKKIGPAESPEAIDKKYKKVFSERDKIRATAKKGDSFKKYAGIGPASEAAEKELDEATAYEKT